MALRRRKIEAKVICTKLRFGFLYPDSRHINQHIIWYYLHVHVYVNIYIYICTSYVCSSSWISTLPRPPKKGRKLMFACHSTLLWCLNGTSWRTRAIFASYQFATWSIVSPTQKCKRTELPSKWKCLGNKQQWQTKVCYTMLPIITLLTCYLLVFSRTLTTTVLAVLVALYILDSVRNIHVCIHVLDMIWCKCNKDDIMNWWHLQTYTHISFVCCNVFTSIKSIISFPHVNTQRLLKTSAATPVVASPALVVQDPNERWSTLEVDLQMLRSWSRSCWV